MAITSRSYEFHIFILLFLIFKAAASESNETSQERRQSRVTGRIVKLYSGTRPEPILCAGEGFQADPRDCAVFYRCMKSGNGKYTVFRFQCGPGTVYDPETEVCNHPRSTKRSECGGLSPPIIDHLNFNEIERNQNEIPSPITNIPIHTDKPKQIEKNEAPISTARPWIASSSTVTTSTKYQLPEALALPSNSYLWASSTGQTYIDHKENQLNTAQYTVVQNHPHTEVPKVTRLPTSSSFPQQSSRDNNICTTDGFMGDSQNCRKFYRCVANQRGTYTRYEFSCSETTLWDDDTQSCNHAWAVKRSRCGRNNQDSSNNLFTTDNSGPQKDNSIDKTIQQQLQISHGSKVTQTQTQISNGSIIQNQTQIHYGDRIKPNIDANTRQNQTQISHGSAVSQTQTQIDYSDKGIQTQLQIDHSQKASQTQVQVHESTTSEASSSSDSSISHAGTQQSNECRNSGFMGDMNDCKKFYRCIDNGRGGYTKFEFSCGEGTVWDQNIEACNHAWAVKDCGGKGSIGTTSTTQAAISTTKSTQNYQSTVSTENYHTTSELIDTEDNEDSGYGQQNQGTTTSSSTTLVLSTTKSPSIEDCQSSGFVGDVNDCKVFYRCVENGKGSFTKYEFKCGEGTVWDPELEACNHAWAVKRCGGNASPDIDKTEITTEKHTPSTVHTQSVIVTQLTTESVATQSDDYDTGYGPVHNDLTPATTTITTKQPQNIEHSTNNNCKSSGFIGDDNDCKKFYRCVDNGNGGYTRYEFTCGEGTVWDSKIEACNHAWAVEKCGGSNQQEATTEPIVSSSSTESIQNTEGPILNPSTTFSTSIITESVTMESSDCTHAGFMGDKKDCKKFYRCVDNGKGSFTKYEFSCGEGTVWDQKIEACNHVWAVENCGGTSEPSDGHHESTTQYHPTMSDEIDNGYPAIVDTISDVTTQSTTTYHTTEGSKETDKGTYCKNSGYIGDKNDCKKFYRCVDNGKGGFIRYEFTCGEGTLWDQSIEACNHEWAVKNCGKTGNSTMQISSESSTQSLSSQQTEDQGYSQNTEETSTTTTISNYPNSDLNNLCSKDGFIGDSNNCKKFYRCVDNGQGGFIKYEFTCGEGTYWNQEILSCDHMTSDKTCFDKESSSSTKPPQYEHDEIYTEVTSISSSSTVGNENPTQKPSASSGVCTSEGFYGDVSDCKKFYRCVNNGKGSYTKYDFTCGDGTIWDQELQTCNHESSNKNCSSSFLPNSNVSQTTETQSEGGNDISMTTTSQIQQSTQATPTSATSSSNQCTSEGFFADLKDCKKFIRCVSNDKGGYTKYEFACGEGTAWVQDILVCDHDTGNANCSSQITTSKPHATVGHEQTTQKYDPNTSTLEPQPIDKQEDEYDNGNSDKPPHSGSGDCPSEGFYANKNDCRQFYRCVDNGQGSYTKYDFTCGEGTAWDSDIQTCNHIDQVKNCHGASETHPIMNDEDNTQSTETSSTMKTTTSDSSQGTTSGNKNTCDKEGYFGDTQDCKKFYRCVDNGNGGYTKYDYTCGEGTIWDQDVTTCNHPQDVANPSCNQNQGGSMSSTTVASSASGESSPSTSSSSTSTTTTTTASTQTSSNCSQEETSKKPLNQNVTCDKEGYYPNPNDCKKFYRCVDWDGDGKRFSVYHFECGEGTIWDPAVETCNHEDSVYPPRDCSGSQSQGANQPQTTEGTTTLQQETTNNSESTTTEKSSTTTTVTTVTTVTTSEQPAQPTTSEQTAQSTTEQTTISQTPQSTSSEQTTTSQTPQSTSSEQTTTLQTPQSTSSQQTTTSQTPQSTSSEQTTTQQSTISDQTTTLQSTSSEQTTTTQQTTTSEETTSQQSTQQPATSENTTTQQSTTAEQATTQQSTVSEQTTSEQTTTSEQSTTEQSTTTEQTTTQQSTSQQATQETTTTEQTTQVSTTEQLTTSEKTTTELSTTSESTTEQSSSTTESSTTEQSMTPQSTTTEQSEQNTTEVSTSSEGTTTEESTTEQSTTEQSIGSSSTESNTDENSSDNKCPETSEDQNLFVCPTSFRRHPKYCNLFYQCDENDDTHDLKIAVFTCPNNTIYDENQTRCVEEGKADKKCNGQIAQKQRFKRLNKDYREPILITTDSHSCPSAGYYSFEKDSECSPAFLKCKTDKTNKLRGLVYQCPMGYIYWTVSKRCEPINKVKDCKRSRNDWTARWEIPVERRNVAPL